MKPNHQRSVGPRHTACCRLLPSARHPIDTDWPGKPASPPALTLMLDARLVGYWSDKHLYLGDMEATDIAFCGDGTGWTDWSNAAGGFEIARFRWQTTGPALVIHMREYVSGTWDPDGGMTVYQQRGRHALDEQISLGYEITPGQNAVGDPATVLQFDQHVFRGVSSNRFALEREAFAMRGPKEAPTIGRAVHNWVIDRWASRAREARPFWI